MRGMLRFRSTLFVLTAVLVAVPALAGESEDFAASAKAWEDGYNAKDAAAVAALYAEDGTIMPPHAAMATGREAIEAYLKTDIAAAPGKLTITYVGSETSGNLAYSHGTFSIADETGKTVDSGKWIEVRKKVNGKWMILYDIWNSDLPM